MAFCQTAWQFHLLSHLYANGVNLYRFVCPNGKLDIGGAGKWHFVLYSFLVFLNFFPHWNSAWLSFEVSFISAIFTQSSSWFWHLHSKRQSQNHEEDCANFCGLLRKPIRIWSVSVSYKTHPLSAKSLLEDGNSDQKISHQHIRQKGSLDHHS